MGGYDVFCAICGAQPEKPDLDDEDFDTSGMDVAWMGDARIICENPDIVSLDK
jgi:hypothetical protein